MARTALVVVLACATSWFITVLVGQGYLERAYHGEAPAWADGFLAHRDVHALAYYQDALRRVLAAGHVLAAVVILLTVLRARLTPKLVLAVLIAADLALLLLGAEWGERYRGLVALDRDGGLPEIFQYLKEAAVVGACVLLMRRRRQAVFFAFATVYAFVLLDDVARIHERAGAALANVLPLAPAAAALTVRPADLGELLAAATAAAILGPWLVWAYRRGSEGARRVARRFGLLLGVLVLFGAVVDLVHEAAAVGSAAVAVGSVEEFGELVVMSATAACAYALCTERGHEPPSVPARIADAMA